MLHYEENSSSDEEPVVLNMSLSSPSKKSKSSINKEDVENVGTHPIVLESGSFSGEKSQSFVATGFPSIPVSSVFGESWSSPSILEDAEPLVLSPFRRHNSNSSSFNSGKKEVKKKKTDKKAKQQPVEQKKRHLEEEKKVRTPKTKRQLEALASQDDEKRNILLRRHG